MITLTPDTVRHLLHRYRHTGEIPALAADWLRLVERVAELERQLIEAAEPFAALVAGHAARIVELEGMVGERAAVTKQGSNTY